MTYNTWSWKNEAREFHRCYVNMAHTNRFVLEPNARLGSSRMSQAGVRITLDRTLGRKIYRSAQVRVDSILAHLIVGFRHWQGTGRTILSICAHSLHSL